MRRMLVTLGVFASIGVIALFAFLIYVLLASGDPKYWEGEIAAFERRDVSNPPPPGAVLFVGGRDVRLWPRLAEDMAPVPVIQRGFGGAQISHVTYYIHRVVLPYHPRAVVVMAGDRRDLGSGKALHSVADLFVIVRKAEIHVFLPVKLLGSAAGAVAGGQVAC